MLVILGSLLIMGAAQAVSTGDEPRRVIVVFEEGTLLQERDAALGRLADLRVKRLSTALDAYVLAGVTGRDVAELLANPSVKRVDDDVIVYALSHTASTQTVQPTPWGIARIKADLVWGSGNSGDPIKVGIIDTGISLSHPDLKDNIKEWTETTRKAKENPLKKYMGIRKR